MRISRLLTPVMVAASLGPFTAKALAGTSSDVSIQQQSSSSAYSSTSHAVQVAETLTVQNGSANWSILSSDDAAQQKGSAFIFVDADDQSGGCRGESTRTDFTGYTISESFAFSGESFSRQVLIQDKTGPSLVRDDAQSGRLDGDKAFGSDSRHVVTGAQADRLRQIRASVVRVCSALLRGIKPPALGDVFPATMPVTQAGPEKPPVRPEDTPHQDDNRPEP